MIKRRLIRWLLIALFAPLLLIIILAGALYLPWIQDWAVGYATREASYALGMQVQIDRLRISFPLGIRLEGLRLLPTPTDTLARLNELTLSVNPSMLIEGHIQSPHINAKGIHIRYTDSLGLTRLDANLKALQADELRLDYKGQRVYLSSLLTESGRIFYHSTDTATTSKSDTLRWLIRADQINLHDTQAQVQLPYDSLYINADIPHLGLTALDIALANTHIQLGKGAITAKYMSYRKADLAPKHTYLDPQYIELSQLKLELEHLESLGDKLSLRILSGEAHERSGITLSHFEGEYSMDSIRMHINDLALNTEYSNLYGRADIPWAIFKGNAEVLAHAQIDGSIGMEDLRSITGRHLLGLVDQSSQEHQSTEQPLTKPLAFTIDAYGTLRELTLDNLMVMWDEVLDINLHGILYDLHLPRKRRGRINLEGGMQQRANSLLGLASPDLAKRYNLPNGLVLRGQMTLGNGMHSLEMELTDRNAKTKINGSYSQLTNHYHGQINLLGVDLSRFMPHDSLGLITADLEAQGRGFDWLSKQTSASVKGRIHSLEYKDLHLEQITADGKLHGGELGLALNSFNPGLNLTLLMDGLLSRGSVYSNVMLESSELDLKALGLASTDTKIRLKLSGELRSDMHETHSLDASISDLHLLLGDEALTPEHVALRLSTSPHHAGLKLTSGDLKLSAQTDVAPSHLAKLSDKLVPLIDQVTRELKLTAPMSIRLEEVISALPRTSLDVEMGTRNALKDYLARQRIALTSLEGYMRLSPTEGLEGNLSLRDLRRDTLRIDCIDLGFSTERTPRNEVHIVPKGSKHKQTAKPLLADSMTLVTQLKVDKQRWRRQRSFIATAEARTTLQSTMADLLILDEKGRTEHDLTIDAGWDGAYYRLHLPKPTLTLAGIVFSINQENIITLTKGGEALTASLDLMHKPGTILSLTASPLEGGGQEGALLIRGLNLANYQSLGLPKLSGILGTDLRYSRIGTLSTQPIITGDLSIQEFGYDGKPLGHFTTALFYEPRNDDSHYITAEISHGGRPALSLDGIYYPNKQADALSGTLMASGFPLEIINPFLAPYATSLRGKTSATLALGGMLTAPRLEGVLRPIDTEVHLQSYATRLRLDTAELRLSDDVLHFDRYAIYTSADSLHPLYLDGYIGATGQKAMQANLRIKAEEITLFNQSRPDHEAQMLYGRLLASTDMRLSGRLDALRLRGSLGILGGTNCTYILREDALDAEGKADGLMKFVDFADTVFVNNPIKEPEFGGLDMSLAINIEPSVRVGVDLTADGRDYVRMQGGGTLQLRYPPFGQMSLLGRYTMTAEGSMYYTMPIAGGKLFTIDSDGYVRFDGNPFNPYVHFTAYQQVRASAGVGQGNTTFKVSLRAEDYVDQIDLGFDLSAPEHLSLQNSIAMMTPQERGKLAIGLLATGTYLGSGGGKFDNALTSLLQSQINTLTNSLLKGTDLNLGMEMGDGTTGVYTNYTYSFSRRFYNDRIRVVVGGKIQTGNTPSGREQNLIDNASIEYQIDQAGERYLQAYRSLVTDNILEGEYSEMGLGYLIRRKLQHLSELFDFRRRRPKATTDSVVASPLILQPFTLPTEPAPTGLTQAP